MTTPWRTAGHAAPWIAVALYAGLIAWISHIPNLAPPGNTPDWIMHVGEYGGLALLVSGAIGARHRTGPLALTVGVAACLAFAVSDELHQSVVPGRSASVRDFAFDAIGLVVGLAAFAGWRAWRGRRIDVDRGAEPARPGPAARRRT
ncbi:MAG: VanZ family protein [Candidatus Polarisedimenticolia bacterium]